MTALVIELGAAEVRRRLGPVPWFILEELLLNESESTNGPFVVEDSSRGLAAAVSLNKDTIARALSALTRAGVVTAWRQSKDAGRFSAGSYQVESVPGVQRISSSRPVPSSKGSQARPEAPRPTRKTGQLALLELAPTARVGPSDSTPPTPPKPIDALAPSVRRRPAGRERDTCGTPERGAGPC